MHLARFALLAFATTAAACSASAADDGAGDQEALSSELLASSSSCRTAAQDPFFDAFPRTGPVRLQSGVVAPTPYRVYDGDNLIIFGTADLDVLRAMTKGTGYFPLETQGNRGLASIFIAKMRCGDLGPYEEVAFLIDVAATVQQIPWVNAFSAFVPLLSPTTVTFETDIFIADNKVHRDYNREVYGLGIAPGFVDVYPTPARNTFSSWTADGRPLLWGQVAYDGSPAAQGATAMGLTAALGLSSPTQLPAPPPVSALLNVSRDARTGGSKLAFNQTIVPTELALNEWKPTDRIHVGTGSALGRSLAKADFKPTLSMRVQAFKGVAVPAPAPTAPSSQVP